MINGQKHTFKEPVTVEQVLEQLRLPVHQGLAVALNYTVVSRDRMSTTHLHDGDKLEVIHATAGG